MFYKHRGSLKRIPVNTMWLRFEAVELQMKSDLERAERMAKREMVKWERYFAEVITDEYKYLGYVIYNNNKDIEKELW